jgi:hypothetical protein
MLSSALELSLEGNLKTAQPPRRRLYGFGLTCRIIGGS